MGELDDQGRTEVGEERDDLVERHGVGEGEVVDDSQAQHQIGAHSIDERRPFARPPTEPGRRIGQVEHEGEDALLALAAELAVEAVDDEIVRVDGDDRPGACVDRDPREPSVVGAEVEHQAWPERRNRFGHEAILCLQRAVCVVATVAVVRPCGVLALPRQLLDRLLQAFELGVDHGRTEPGAFQFGIDVPFGVGHRGFAFGSRVQLDMGENPLLQPSGALQCVGGDCGWDTVDAAPQHRLEGDVAQCLEEQWVEEQLAELAIAGPRLASTQPLEGADVDEDRARADELDVVRRGVLGDEFVGQRLTGEPELQSGGVAEHLERPFVWIGEHVDAIVAENGGPVAGEVGDGRVDPFGADDVASLEGSPVEGRRGECLEIGECRLRQPSPHPLGVDEDARQGIAKRTGICRPVVLGCVCRVRQRRCHCRRRRRQAVRERRPPEPCATWRTVPRTGASAS